MSIVNVSLLNHFQGNARKGNVAAIAQSLSEFGQFRPIVVNKGALTGRPNEILAGNHTFLAAVSLGWSEIEVDYVDVDDATAKKINLVDNRSADLSDYDHEKLQELMEEILAATAVAEIEENPILDITLGEPAEPKVRDTSKPQLAEVKMADIVANIPFTDAPAAGVVREVPKQVGADKQGESIADNTDKYLDGATRHLFLEWTVEEFNEVTANLIKLGEAWELKTNGEVVKRILGL
jgi:hypothetical protein